MFTRLSVRTDEGMNSYIVSISVWIVLCLVSFCQFGIDKKRARQGQWRIPEKTLWITAALGGSAGAWLGMYVFHHKTRHAGFRFGMPALIVIQLLAAIGALYFF